LRLSLRWRIAAAYAILLIVTLAATSAVLVWRLQTILYDEARSRIDQTMNEIVSAVQPVNPLPFGNVVDESLLQIFNSNNLAVWETPTTFIQVDTVRGYPIARSPNLGSLSIPPNTSLDAKHNHVFREVELGARRFLVEDRLLRSSSSSRFRSCWHHKRSDRSRASRVRCGRSDRSASICACQARIGTTRSAN
jgi:hypothetical protein